MRFDIVTLMPALFEAAAQQGVTGRAFSRRLVQQILWNPRDYTHDVHRTVDDRPYGGGPGMVMKYEPLRAALDSARAAAPDSPVVYLSPQGRRLDQAAVSRFAGMPGLILLCGRYEGIDERIIECCVDEEWSIGDYVLSGGEVAALALMDAVIRLLPEVLGDEDSAKQDSFVDGLLDCPHYTRPETIEGRQVPAVLLSGDHEAIRRWRLKQALIRTLQRRPDLMLSRNLSVEEQILLDEYIESQAEAGENRSK